MQELFGQLARPPFTAVDCATLLPAWLGSHPTLGCGLVWSLTCTSEGHVGLQTPTWWRGVEASCMFQGINDCSM
eukprot:6688159-Pyramimonas_sp.AAC.1